MSRFSTDYQIGRSSGLCAATGRELAVGEACVVTLCEPAEGDGFERHDFSEDAWREGARPDRLFSFWKAVVPEPDAKRNLFVDDDVLMDLFERLADDERPQRVAFRFVLGLILLRKKKLKFTGRREEGDVETWLMQPRGGEEEVPPHEVVNPKLADDDVRELTAQLGEILQGEL